MSTTNLPNFPYGAVYYRRSNPPEADWERDYQQAASDGMNIFRHWFLWSAIETAPGVYNWREYDRQLELAARYGLKTIIAEMITTAPEWAFRSYAHARYETADGRKLDAMMSGGCATGGFPGLCYDNEDASALAERFLRELAAHYKGHPALAGYDLWNEIHFPGNCCYCAGTLDKFRAWLKAKYGDLKTLGEAWFRYSFADWADVTPPVHQGPYPDTLDWLQFRLEDAYRLMRWRRDVIRGIDPDCALTAHGTASTFHEAATACSDDWRGAEVAESFGCTWGSSRQGDEPWKQFQAFDLVRAASRGKRFWYAETFGGPLWLQPQVIGKPRDEGRIPSPEDLRYWDMLSYMLGATGMFYVRWRGLLDGPLFGAFGLYSQDGTPNPRSEMAARIGKWVTAPGQEALWRSRPVPGDIGIVYAPETELFTYAQHGSTDLYLRAMRGAYRGFHANNIQADWVHIDDIAAWRTLYLPIPYMLTRATAERLAAWVRAGGTLISEGCPAYFGDRGHVGTVQPNYGLDELFGARESYVEFTPDILGDLQVTVNGITAWGGVFLQAYQPTTGTPVGYYADGRVAAVEHTSGAGRTLLIGTMPGEGCFAHGTVGGHEPDPPASLFADLLRWAGIAQHVVCSDPRVKARLHAGAGGAYLWLANPMRQAIPVRLELSAQWGPFKACTALWGGVEAAVRGRMVTLTAPARDVAVLRMEP
ncbi:MAG: beta-galactosidase [Anaerolineae bacterium]